MLLVVAILATTNSAAQAFAIDPTFQVNITEDYVSSVEVGWDGKILISGRVLFQGSEGTRRNSRLFDNGIQDNLYYSSGLGGGTIVPRSGGACYIGTDQTVRRLLPSGFLDPSFLEMNLSPYFASLQGGDYHVFNDDRVVMSGQHLLMDSIRGFEGIYSLIWFSNEGYLDTTRIHRQSNGRMFEFEAYPEGSVPEVEGKFLCSTQGTQYEGQPVGKVFRIHPEGALDTTYQSPLSNFGWVEVIHPFPDGSALLGGAMKLVGGTDTLSLLKLLPDGSLDPEFHTASFTITTFYASLTYVHDIEPLIDGRFIVTGTFERIDDVERECIALMNADGTLNQDEFNGVVCGDFSNVITPYRGIKGITPAPNGSYYIYGAYHGYHDGTTNYPQQRFISRLYGLYVGIAERNALSPLVPYPNPGTGTFTLELPLSAPAPLEVLDASGRVVHTQLLRPGTHSHTVQSALPAGVYLLRVQEAQGVRRGRVVVE
jgi:hypothetical protein